MAWSQQKIYLKITFALLQKLRFHIESCVDQLYKIVFLWEIYFDWLHTRNFLNHISHIRWIYFLVLKIKIYYMFFIFLINIYSLESYFYLLFVFKFPSVAKRRITYCHLKYLLLIFLFKIFIQYFKFLFIL